MARLHLACCCSPSRQKKELILLVPTSGEWRRSPSKTNPTITMRLSTTKLLLLSFALLLAGPAVARGRHVITASAPDLHPSGLAWDPTAQHFIVGHRLRPAVHSVSDAGILESLISDPLLPPDSSAAALTVDDARRRLLVALSLPAAVAAYDLRSPRPHRRLFLTPLPDPTAVPGGITVDPSTGAAFVTSATGGVVYRIDPEGGDASVLSRSPIYGEDEGLGGVAHVRGREFLLVVQRSTGRVFKVDAEDGAAREVTVRLAAAEAVAVMADGAAVVGGGRTVRVVRSEDGWSRAAAREEAELEGAAVGGLAVRDGRRAYVLLASEGKKVGREEGIMGRDEEKEEFRVEEVEWEREGDMVWGMVLLGLGMAYFLYWRFQMRQLATNLNKKRA